MVPIHHRRYIIDSLLNIPAMIVPSHTIMESVIIVFMNVSVAFWDNVSIYPFKNKETHKICSGTVFIGFIDLSLFFTVSNRFLREIDDFKTILFYFSIFNFFR